MSTARKHIALPLLVLLLQSFALLQDKLVWKTIPTTELENAGKEISAYYTYAKLLSVDIVHQTYKGHTSAQPHDRSEGYFKADGNQYHSYLAGIHTIQNKQLKFVVDTAGKLIVLADARPLNVATELNASHLTAQKHIQACKKTTDKGLTLYRVEYKAPFEMEATELHLNLNHSIAAIHLYMRKALPLSNEKGAATAKPKASILYKNYNTKPVFAAGEFTHLPYFKLDGQKPVLTKKYSHYKIVDNRIDKK